MNDDGSCTVQVVDFSTPDENGNASVVETRQASAEDYAAFEEAIERFAKNVGGYDSLYEFNYRSPSEEGDKALKEITDKYGLKLRAEARQAWTNPASGAPYTAQELSEMTAQMGNAGNIFRQTPPDFDKVYWFDEGSYYAILEDGSQATCYGYNSMYATLSSGSEVINWEQDLEAFAERTYQTADGTEVTILSHEDSAYLYVYLEHSFFAMHISAQKTLTETELNAIADGLNYSLMGR